VVRVAIALLLLGTAGAVLAQQVIPTDSSAPLALRSEGLARRSFLYAGESHQRRIFVVREGKIVWSYDDPAGKGEISDAVMLSNGNILFAHQFGVTEIDAAKRVVWNYEPPAGHEVHTAVPIGKDRVLFIQNGDPAVVRVVNIVSGATEKEFPLEAKHPVSVHGQFRHARLTANGTLLVAHMDLNKVVEYDSDGKELWSFPAPGAWGVTPLQNSNVLIVDRVGVREVTRRGDAVWSFTPAEAPEYKFAQIQQAWRLANGDTVVNNWLNEWNQSPESMAGSLQALELTPEKKAVSALVEWTPSANLGPATTIQFLDEGRPAVEDVHFGDIR
jgi:hypothetical protein